MQKILFISIFIFLSNFTFSQDEITVMQYNLLGYDSNDYIDCNSTNNNLDKKDSCIRIILDYVKPDIMTVNEISTLTADHDRIKTKCFNINGVTTFKRGTITNYSGSSICNQIYYNSAKLYMVTSDAISNDLRDINIYKFRYTKTDISGNYIYLYCIIAHLKAGTYDEDAAERAQMTSYIMSNMSNNMSAGENVLVMGDFNLYTGYEQAYQNLIANSNVNIKFFDPVDAFGDWGNNSYYAQYHTQSTHTSDNGCASTGGLDDRFDFILATNSIMNATKKVSYISNSYMALGQDGTRYNSSLNTSSNEVVPNYVAKALYDNSDHLPVVLKLKIETGASGIEEFSEFNGLEIRFKNPSSENFNLIIDNTDNYKGELSVEIYSLLGQNLFLENINIVQGLNQLNIKTNNIKAGVYILKTTDKDKKTKSCKLILE